MQLLQISPNVRYELKGMHRIVILELDLNRSSRYHTLPSGRQEKWQKQSVSRRLVRILHIANVIFRLTFHKVQAEEQSVEAVEMVLGDIVEEDEDELDGGSGSDAELERMAKVLRGADLTKSTLEKDIGDLTSLPIAQSTPQRTPLRTRVRSGDETQASRDEIVSETDFPYPGTRARGEKKRRLDEVKKKPFTPFRGTRAAQLASRRTAVAVDGK